MRSRLFVCAALASLGLVIGVARLAHAADAKAKGGKKSDDTDKGISKTLQWEEKVLGDDDKRAELDKILKAQAINKAATEKAEKEKAQREKEDAARAAKEAAAPKPQQKKGGEVALPALPDEGVNKTKVKPTEISPKLDSASAAAAPPPSKPADDKFIDKLLKEEGGKKKKVAAGADNKELLDILSTEKKGPPNKKKAASEVDKMLLEADKPAAPIAKIKHETPEWQKPEIQSTPVQAPIAQPKPQPKRDDGVIRVVQGAAGSSSSSPSPASTSSRPTPVAARSSSPMVPASRKAAASAPGGNWNDPFADSGSRKTVASRSVSRASDDDDFAPAPRRNASSASAKSTSTRATSRRDDADAWEDPFDAKKAAAARKTAAKPAKAEAPGRWKDPFTDESPRSRGSVAMRARDDGHSTHREEPASHKWDAARRAPAASDDETPASAHGRWGVIKKRH